MAEYFYIVEPEASGAVVDIAHNPFNVDSKANHMINMKGSSLKLSKWNGADEQVWKWTADGSLQNKKSHLVISIGKGRAAVVEAKDGSSYQKWRLEDGMLRNQEQYDANLTRGKSNLLFASSTSYGHSLNQKWLLIPQATWNAYREYLYNPNPLIKALILKENLLEHLECILGCTIEEYEEFLAQCISTANDCTAKLHEVIKGVGKAKIAGGSATIAGGAMSLLGLILAPITAGASLALTVGGAVAAGAGGLTSLGATITESCYNKEQLSKIKPVIEKTIRFSTGLRSLILDVCKEIEQGLKFSKTQEGISFRQMLKKGCKAGKKAYKTGKAVKKGVDNFKAFKQIKSIVAFVEADAQVVKGATVGLAENAAASGLKVPVTGKVLLQAGSTGAKVFSGALSFLGIAFGIWDVVKGAKQMEERSEAAKQMKASAEDINKEGQTLIKTYNGLSQQKLEFSNNRQHVSDLTSKTTFLQIIFSLLKYVIISLIIIKVYQYVIQFTR